MVKEMERKEKGNTATHVLVLPYPSQGHISPMLQFAKRLVFKGIKATLATTLFIINSVKAEESSVSIEPISDGYDDDGFEAAESIEAYLESFKVVGLRTLRELIEKLDSSGCPIHCLVYDAFLPWALDLAKELGLSGAAFFTQTCTIGSIYYHVYAGKISPTEITISRMPGLPSLENPDLPSFFSTPESYPAYLELVLNQFSNLEKADWVLFNSFDNLEPEVVKWMEGLWPVKTIGPAVPSMYLDKRIEGNNSYGLSLWKTDIGACRKWLDTRAIGSVIYMSFGSMASLEEEQIEELAWGIKQSNKDFLWVVRASEECKLPRKFVEETAEKGSVTAWSPQLEVLAHQSIGCFVTHCGWNSTLEALCLGVPMVAIPQWTDQPLNAKCVEDLWGVGVRARVDNKGIVRKSVLEMCIKEVMEGNKGKEMKKNADTWRVLAREAVDEGGSSDKNIEDFVAALEQG